MVDKNEIEEYLEKEKLRVSKLYKEKHRNGFITKETFVDWYIKQIQKQDFKCYYCETSIFYMIKLIESNYLKARKIGYGVRGKVLEIDKKVNENGYNPENCVLACYYCNNDKSYTIESDEYKKYFGNNRKKYFENLLKSSKK